ncbi:hypothetical protein [Bifidobacterium criceti]|uniref:Uncharacterized protein n=1 Tax=Bifidobacterium criceti TaxID=1960969 RepID=A0A2A2EIL1_9BIFI|nr:hypothetical protein [Bifidobacterium criceti]PAU68802.1 hypothetical protein B1526_0228 [Bifidobacterium criceti]
MKTLRSKKFLMLISALIIILLGAPLTHEANAAESPQEQASYSVQQTDSGVLVSLSNAVFKKNADGSVAILSPEGKQLDSLPSKYLGNTIEYQLMNDSELVATKGKPAVRSPFSAYRQSYLSFNGGEYAGCIAKTALGAGVTGGVAGAVTGPGAAAGLLGGLVGGLVWGPIGCWLK